MTTALEQLATLTRQRDLAVEAMREALERVIAEQQDRVDSLTAQIESAQKS